MTGLPAHAAAQDSVRGTLARLEAGHRDVALFGLSEWASADVSAASLFHAVAGLQRPSWGAWNGLLVALRRARRDVLRAGAAEHRRRLEQAAGLAALLARLDERIDERLRVRLAPLADLTRTPWRGRIAVRDVLALPIGLRNRVVHDAPADPSWWADAAAALEPLVAYHDAARPCHVPDSLRREPWFVHDAGDAWTFNGVERDFSIVYVSRAGVTRHDETRSQDVLLAFQRLLGRSDVQAGDFRRLLGKLAPEEIRGVLIGDYLVGRPVGSGGFAMVHVGRQLSTGRKVAVKILRDGMPEDSRFRFQQEAAYLSRFDHPHIVGVLGYGEEPWRAPRSGLLDDEVWWAEFRRGAPVKSFIALEWIDGRTLDDVFGADALDTRRIATWFAQVAGALAAVHATGLIHRDVKPTNVMLTESGDVKLMDFGIARTQEEDRTLQTTTGHVVGTPAYMSPEQVRAADAEAEVGPASDVYSLSATFYELFTGQRLFGHDSESLESVRTRKLRGEAPVRPRRHVRGLPWEIETILLGGLEPEVADRYPSADQLERDVRHFLADEAIEYRRPSWGRRLRLGYRRNRTVTNLAGAFGIAVIAGTAFYISRIQAEQERTAEERDAKEEQRRVAVRERDRAEDLAGFMLFDMRDRLTPLGRLDLLEPVARKVKAYYESVPPGDVSDSVERRRAVALENISFVFQEKGDVTAALEALRSALEVRERIVGHEPSNPLYQRDLAIAHSRIGAMLRLQGATDEAMTHYQRSREISAAMAAVLPGSAGYQDSLVGADISIGNLLRDQGRFDDALARFRAAVERGEKALAGHVDDDDVRDLRGSLSLAHDEVANVMQDKGLFAEAMKHREAAYRYAQELVDSHPDDLTEQRDLTVSLAKIGELHDLQRQYGEAIDWYRKALVIRERLAAHDPLNATWTRDLAMCRVRIADALNALGEGEKAAEELGRALLLTRQLAAADPSDVRAQRDLTVALSHLGQVRFDLRDYAGSLALYSESRDLTQRLCKDDPSNVENLADLGLAHLNVGDSLRKLDRMETCREQYETGLRICEQVGELRTTHRGWRQTLRSAYERAGDVQRYCGDPKTALATYQRGLGLARELLAEAEAVPMDRRGVSLLLSKAGEAELVLGHGEAAARLYRELVDNHRALVAELPSSAGELTWAEKRLREVELVAGVREAVGAADQLTRAYGLHELGRFAAAVEAFSSALADEGTQADLVRGNLYNAACAAARAAANADGDAAADYRAKALGWLREDLRLRRLVLAQIDTNLAAGQSEAQARQLQEARERLMKHFSWARDEDGDLAPIRGSDAFAALFEELPAR